MKRKIIHIDSEKCNGCGLCVEACHEGAIGMVEGKARLLRDDYCDGLGDCLPACPTNAISFVEREAAAYDEAAVKANIKSKQEKENTQESSRKNGFENSRQSAQESKPLPCGCPGTHSKHIIRSKDESQTGADLRPQSQTQTRTHAQHGQSQAQGREQNQSQFQPRLEIESRLSQWPVQIKLVPVNAPYFNGANLLIAADCTAYAYGDFHNKFIKNHVTLIGCPKLDMTEYSEKLTQIIKNNDIKSVKIVRMEVPCCGGIENAAKEALKNSGKFIPWQVYTVSVSGEIIE